MIITFQKKGKNETYRVRSFFFLLLLLLLLFFPPRVDCCLKFSGNTVFLLLQYKNEE